MSSVYTAQDFQTYTMDYHQPHAVLEPAAQETAVVHDALAFLMKRGLLPHTQYDPGLFVAHRAAVREQFEIPWTAITPRMQRLLYAINAIARPQTMIAVGVFCGNTFISNAGAGAGPGACYRAKRLVGIEIVPAEAARARRNVAAIDPEGRAEIVTADGVAWLQAFTDTGDLLYIDASSREHGKSIYLDILRAALHALRPGSLVLAHNSYNLARDLAEYLAFVRNPRNMRDSVNVLVDGEGLEVSVY